MIYDLDFALKQTRKWLDAVEASAKNNRSNVYPCYLINNKIMTEDEYKDYLSEQDRLKREAEEMAGETLTLIRKLQDD